jgi:hypothetical protein
MKLIGYARVSTRQQSTDRNRWIFWPPVSGMMTATWITVYSGREPHGHGSGTRRADRRRHPRHHELYRLGRSTRTCPPSPTNSAAEARARSIDGRELSSTSHVASSSLKGTPSDQRTPPRSEQIHVNGAKTGKTRLWKNRHNYAGKSLAEKQLARVWHQIWREQIMRRTGDGVSCHPDCQITRTVNQPSPSTCGGGGTHRA